MTGHNYGDTHDSVRKQWKQTEILHSEDCDACNDNDGARKAYSAVQTVVVLSELQVSSSRLLRARVYSLFFLPGIGILDWIL